jgi:hypothetical protein
MSDLRTRIAAAMRKEFYENEEATDDDCTWVNWELMADVVIEELGRCYEDSLQSSVFSAIRMVERHQASPRHFTQEADDE